MTPEQRVQVRLIIEHEIEARTKEFEENLRAMYSRHAARGHLKAGITIKMAVRYMEDTTVALIKNAIEEVSKVAMDVDAFTTIHAAVHEFEELLRRRLDDAFHKATGHTASSGLDRAAHGAATRLYEEQRVRTLRQLEIHRFSFTKPSVSPAVAMQVSLVPKPKNKGGRPAAAHWDEMWSALAVMLYVGDLKPRRQADIERAMKDWLVANGYEAGDTPVRERARVLWSKLESAD
jgi:hypothetical protein